MKTGVIVQARMGSTRLPGKVLLNLNGQSVLSHVVERCKQISRVDEVIIATTNEKRDDPIVNEASKLGVPFYRGSEEDVLSRYVEAANLFQLDVIIRVTSDCPLIDPTVSSEIVEHFFALPMKDYCSNTLERSYPRGLDTEVFSIDVIKKTNKEASLKYQREHVTPYIYENRHLFNVMSIKSEKDYSRYRWTLDTQEDWVLIEEIYSKLHTNNRTFTWREAIRLMESIPELSKINEHIEQKNLHG
ncbi:glycosyltransferase family protein [Brevibacillus agri]|uniref:glycosyltransferase family protein n=1 Tax=Brevibacillus agri TaxID=51101 RepID=UPI002E1F4F28|nr:glycosyltransferase family protein [Brevibacillus agri]MED1655877.1 glycosyltransferase family protein [Brevibacillus agri]MED1685014.1 glycosyltransferase family protein [Brevibacillus agri]MED1693613.1 glycosyltransferase family protein [Brevibacillus agri]MED1697573.1 glycosyltransferase family protein [Brevibacillus agri]